MQAGEDVKVVFHSVDPIQVAPTVLDNAPDVAEEVVASFLPEHGPAVLGGKHDVVGDGGIGGHGPILRRPVVPGAFR